jgi:glycerol-3-phosphate cytidylyltransferase-like family protein
VDDVLIDAPFHVTMDMINSLKIDVVVTGAPPTSQAEEGR